MDAFGIKRLAILTSSLGGRMFGSDVYPGFTVDQERKNIGTGIMADGVKHAFAFSDQGRIEFCDRHSLAFRYGITKLHAFRRNDHRVAAASQSSLQLHIWSDQCDLVFGQPTG